MELQQEIIKDNKELSREQKENFAKTIAGYFQKWNEDRSSQVATAREIMTYTYLNQGKKKEKDPELEWKSDVRLNSLYNIKRTKKSVIWREIWQNTNQMFDVRGTNKQTEELAKFQKAAIVDSLEKMEIAKQYDNAIDNLYDIGEMIFKTDWEKREKVVKRQKKGVGFVLENIMRSITGAGYTTQMQDVTLPYYENARVESISPFMFVFDHAKYKLKNKKSWDSCIKIYKRFDSLDNVKSNKVYKITNEMIQDLEVLKENQTAENKELSELRDENQYGEEYSILYAHGDFKINGKLYKNYIAEVLAGKYLIRFEENPMYINPFILCALEFDPDTKRGISPLKAVLNMTIEEERLTNNAFDVQKLTVNPVHWCNEDLFDEKNTLKDGKILYSPGKLLPYKNNYDGALPQRVEISANGISDLLGLLTQKIADTSSVSAVMYGNIESDKRTATELSLADKGASSQASKELDTINQDLTVPMIENVAELLAMFKDGVDFVYFQEKGENVEYKITNQIRQAQYQYIYEDRNAIEDRKGKFKEVYQIFTAVAQDPHMSAMINWREVITTAIEMTGFDNPDKFFIQDNEASKLAEQFKTLPDEVKGQLIPMFTQLTQQTMANFKQQQRQKELQTQAINDIERQEYKDNVKMAQELSQMGAVA